MNKETSLTVILCQDCVLRGLDNSQAISIGGGDSAIDLPHSSMLNSNSYASVRRVQSQATVQSSNQTPDSYNVLRYV